MKTEARAAGMPETVRKVAVWLVLLRWLQQRQRLLACVALLGLSAHNHWISSSRRAYKDTLHLAQTVFFIVRKTCVVLARRVLGIPHHPYWNPLEEVAMGTINFCARIGDVTAPRQVLAAASVVRRTTSAWMGASIIDVDLGLGHGTGDALWITHRPGIELGSCPVMLYYHGGGYAVGNASMYLEAHLELVRVMERDFGTVCGVLSIEYPLAPETQFPHNLNFGKRAFDALVDDVGVSPARVVVAGDSAGGGMALAVAQHSFARRVQEGKRRPAVAGLVLVSPWVNHSCESESHELHSTTDCIAGTELIHDYSVAYCGDHDMALKDPSISFVHAEVHDLPPVMLTIGSREVFSDDIELFTAKLKRAGKAVEVHRGADCPHIYPMLWPLFHRQSTEALSQIADFCVRRIQFREQHNRASCGWADRIMRAASWDEGQEPKQASSEDEGLRPAKVLPA